MKRINPSLKKVILITTIVIAFVILSLISLAFFINPNKYKSVFEDKFYKSTGRNLVLSGPISLSLFPTIHVNAQQVAISNTTQNTTQIKPGYFIEIPSIDFSIELLPLLKGTFHFTSITLDGLTLNLIKNKYTNNWSFSQANDEQSTANIAINKVTLTNTKLSYKNLEKNNGFATKIFNLLINQDNGEIEYNKDQLSLRNISFDLNKNFHAVLDFKVTSKPDISYQGSFLLRSASLAEVANIFNYKLPKFIKNLGAEFKMSSKLNGTENKLDFNGLQFTLGNTNLIGDINIGINPYQINNNLKVNQLNIQDFVNLQGFKLKVESIDLIGRLSTDSQMRIATLNGQEMIKAQEITLYGLDLKRFSHRITKVINDISIFRRLITYTHSLETVRLLRQAIAKIKWERGKNHGDKSSLGQFKGIILADKGNLSIKDCKLSGPNLAGFCRGGLLLNSGKLNLVLQGRILPQEQQTFINYIYFPYSISGNLDHLSDGLDWPYIIKQTTNYYNSTLAQGYNGRLN